MRGWHLPVSHSAGVDGPDRLALIDRLLERYPGTIAGIKDSSGDWNNTRACSSVPAPWLRCLRRQRNVPARHAARGRRRLRQREANVNPAAIAKLGRDWQTPDATRSRPPSTVRAAFQKFPMIPALKSAVAHFSGEASWTTVRPPLVALSDNQKGELIASLNTLGFAMPGLAHEETQPLAQITERRE